MTSAQPLAATRARDSRIFERHADNWYVEPSWVWTRLFERMGWAPGTRIHDPACGGGTVVETACAAGYIGSGGDIVARWHGKAGLTGAYACSDFVGGRGAPDADIIVSNPPFKLARVFAETALEAAPTVCFLLQATWACGDAKARWLTGTPLSDLLFLTPRPSMLPSAGVLPGTKLGGGTKDYAIFVWSRGHEGAAVVGWLHRDGDRSAEQIAERVR